MTDESVDVLLNDLRSALEVDPSPSFPARVRAAVGDDSIASRVWGWPLGLGLAGVVSAAGLAAVWLAVTPVASSNVVKAPAPFVAHAGTAPAPVTRPLAATFPAQIQAARASGTAQAPRIETIVARYDGMDVIVPLDQAAALSELLGGVRRRGVLVPAERVVLIEARQALPELTPITISRITIEPLVADDDEGGLRRDQ